jgi:spermidine synthase
MKPWQLLGETRTPEGQSLVPTRRGRELVFHADGKSLMSSRKHGSEEALARFGCRHLTAHQAPRALVGGPGMGSTLRATLDALGPGEQVVVAELVPAVVGWNRGPLAAHPLRDRRVRVAVGDVAALLRARPGAFDAVLLDVDNGPSAFTQPANAGLYDDAGLVAARDVLAVRSARVIFSSSHGGAGSPPCGHMRASPRSSDRATADRRRAFGHRLPLCVTQPRHVLHLKRHARVPGQRRFMARQEVPVQRGERAGAFAAALRGVVAAARAERAHALDVLPGGDVGLAAHHAAIGVLAHAEGIGQLDPFHGVDVHRQVPGVNLLGLHTQHQRVQAGDHQALDVVGVAVRQRLRERVA